MLRIAANITKHGLEEAKQLWFAEFETELHFSDEAKDLVVIADSLEDAYAGACSASMREDFLEMPVHWFSLQEKKVKAFKNLPEMIKATARELEVTESQILGRIKVDI